MRGENELVVPESAEDITDEFDRLEREIGPFPIALGDDDEAVEFQLDEWSVSERGVLVGQLLGKFSSVGRRFALRYW